MSRAIRRVDRLGAVSERLFSRLYRTITRRAGSGSSNTAALAPMSDTQRLREQVRQRDREIERLGAVLATIEEGVIMQDEEGRLVLINEAARALLGGIKAFWESELGAMFTRFRQQTENASNGSNAEGIAGGDGELTPMGEPTRVQVNNRILGAQMAVVSGDRGERLGTLIVLRDITQDVLSERMKNSFVTAISHELRTPMSVIKGMSEVLGEQITQGRTPGGKLFETLSRNVDILDRMVVELLDISELDAGEDTIRLDHGDVELEPLLWSVVNGQMPDIRRGSLDVSVMRSHADLRLRVDAQKLKWALGHLVQNAVRYTEPGGHLIITARREGAPPLPGERDAGQVSIQVLDTGVGISERDLPHIFERFYRGDARTPAGRKIDPRGLGQGLYIAQRVAEAHGGYLSVSRLPVGSVFTLVLPVSGG